MNLRLFLAFLSAAALVHAQEGQPEVSVRAKRVAIQHARVVDATAPTARENQTLVIQDGRITAVGPDGQVPIPDGAKTIDAKGKTLLPGLVMVHEHLYYAVNVGGRSFHTNQMDYSFPRLYLACGLTSIRTGGSIEPYSDMEIRRRIDAGEMIGPKMHLTSPYIEGPPSFIAQLHAVTGPEDAVRLVDYWATQGFTSVKLYVHLRKDVAAAAIAAAHRHGMLVTGHLGVMTYREAADVGIDNLEHGFFASTDFVRGKQENELPVPAMSQASLEAIQPDSPAFIDLVQYLIAHHVAITSTLPVFEGFVAGRPILPPRVLDCMSEAAKENYLGYWSRVNQRNAIHTPFFLKMIALEKKFFDAGGLLVAGTDPTGGGNVVAGHGSVRELELLVEGGFTPMEAIRITTLNGAKLLKIDREVGTLEPGKAADLLLIDGNPLETISDIRKIETVFKDGIGYDSQRLLDSVRGSVGIQ